MDIQIRDEEIRDFHPVAEIQALAFNRDAYIGEVQIVDAQRHGAAYNPQLSLVAVLDGKVVGHVFFYPHRMYVGGEQISAVSLAPIAIHPDYQKMGIGTRLMQEGHRRARQLGYALSFLIGHDTYYPRFGYLTGMFGVVSIDIETTLIPPLRGVVTQRQVRQEDLPCLVSMWESWFAGVDLALFPGNSIIDWVSHSPKLISAIVQLDGHVIGYLRHREDNPLAITCFLALDEQAAQVMLSYLKWLPGDSPLETITLPLHPTANTTRDWIPLPFKPVIEPWNAAMIKILNPDVAVVKEYCEGVRSGERPIGLVVYPPIFETA